ncbi:phospholipase/carboxylesterase [Psychrobacillus insolitus]|uniref:Phospholipase/carboxylesterase n=1 Tax=Psychrobacillus insolitus TaxID=1461 RepID=A0A2W7N0P5_9BACI|nr:alpha/beta hydrolase [Psychrobacillus insolitus]PZX03915.1 phospholipase/carboxylesterase [Psychrobacillus insolitus]
MKHVFYKGEDSTRPTLLLLHGTGGNEHDLVGLGKEIDGAANILSVRGNVLENGMPRFFKRLAEGVFDLEDLQFRTEELKNFIDESAKNYEFDRDNVVAIGYSNGANIAGNLLFEYENVLKGAILHHPMVPRRGVEIPALPGAPVFIGAGKNDFMCPAAESEELRDLLQNVGAEVELFWHSYGHQLTQDEVQAAKEWYKTKF